MYHINTIPGEAAKVKRHASYPEDFPHLQPGQDFAAWKIGEDWEVETTLDGEALYQRLKSLEENNPLQKQIESASHDPYKVEQLSKMLAYETRENETHYGARLHHEGSGAKVLTIDAGGLRALIDHYSTHCTDLENGEEE